MTIQEQFEVRWNKIVDRAYEQNENFDYKKTKKIVKDVFIFYDDVVRKQKETITTINLVEFNSNQEIKKDLEDFIQYAQDMQEYLENIIILEPKSKKGYYNYLKNMMGYL